MRDNFGNGIGAGPSGRSVRFRPMSGPYNNDFDSGRRTIYSVRYILDLDLDE